MVKLEYRNEDLILLSHVMSADTPAYANGEGVEILKVRDMCCGDSCNAAHLSLPNHIGSHVDAQKHFIKDGRSIPDYPISDWFFKQPYLIDIPVQPGQLLCADDFKFLNNTPKDTDLLLVRTGMEKFREQDIFWQSAPGYHEELASFLREKLPKLKAIGMDSISLSSLHHREMGRAAHTSFLGRDIRIFEDLALLKAPDENGLAMVIALPFIYENADGAPCTIVGIQSMG